MRAIIIFSLLISALRAQVNEPDRLLQTLTDRAMADHVANMATDERIKMYEALVNYKPSDLHYQSLLAGAFIQKMRETMDPGYLDRAAQIVHAALATDSNDYEALRLRSQIELERHNFTKVAEYSRELTASAPDDPWNWGTLGDSLMELGQYDKAADAYQRMVSLRPDLSSYNRASYYRFVAGDAAGAIEVMKQAINAGSRSMENVAWCYADLGNMYFKIGQVADAERAYLSALRAFPGYYPAYAGLGRAYAAQGRIAEAIDSYKRAQSAVPLVEYAGALQDLYTLARQPEEARKQAGMVDMINKMEQASGLNVNRNLAMAYADRDRNLDRALSLVESELSGRRDIYTYDALAWALYKNKKYDQAAKAKEKALELGTPEPAFYYHAGMIERALGQNDVARKHLEKALALNARFDPRQAPLAEAALKEIAQ
ncbi:MAG TPA: tetratricopeptide repeat protein [Bryobacteraceae bacterium]|nr:tetratricopeptide repeat protein [Bryobacteraceae bacterium]